MNIQLRIIALGTQKLYRDIATFLGTMTLIHGHSECGQILSIISLIETQVRLFSIHIFSCDFEILHKNAMWKHQNAKQNVPKKCAKIYKLAGEFIYLLCIILKQPK